MSKRRKASCLLWPAPSFSLSLRPGSQRVAQEPPTGCPPFQRWGECMYGVPDYLSSLYIGGPYPAKHLDALGNLMKKTGIKVQSRSLASSLHAGGVLALPARLPSHGGGDIIGIIIISRRDLRPASSCNGRRMHGWAHQVPSGLERAEEAWKQQVQGSAGKAKRTW